MKASVGFTWLFNYLTIEEGHHCVCATYTSLPFNSSGLPCCVPSILTLIHFLLVLNDPITMLPRGLQITWVENNYFYLLFSLTKNFFVREYILKLLSIHFCLGSVQKMRGWIGRCKHYTFLHWVSHFSPWEFEAFLHFFSKEIEEGKFLKWKKLKRKRYLFCTNA